MRVEFSGNQFQVDGSGWFNNSPALSLALASLLDLILTAYQAEAPDIDRLGAFDGRDITLVSLTLNAESIDFKVAAILSVNSEEGSTLDVSAVEASRLHSQLSSDFLSLLQIIEDEVTA